MTFKVVRNKQGQALTEYMTLLILVSLVAVGVTQGLGRTIKGKIKKAQKTIGSQLNLKEGRNSGSEAEFEE